MDRNDFARLKVLVADPSPHMASLMGSLLRSIGVKDVVEVSESRAAQFTLGRQAFDVVLIEEALAPVDGIKITRALRQDADNANRQAAVIMTFSVAELRRIQEARDAGVSEFIRKPLSAAILAARIEAALANPRSFVATKAYTGPDRRRKRVSIAQDRRAK